MKSSEKLNDFDFEQELAKIEASALGINTKSKILDPKADIVFKAIFAQNTKESEMVRKDLLSSILGQKILAANLIRNEPATMSEDEKSSRFDLFVRLDNKEEVNVEIQLKNLDDMLVRSEFYVCKMFAGQQARGRKYTELHKACQISILNFTLFPQREDFMDEYMHRNAAGDILSGNTKIIFVELGKILKLVKKPVEEMSGVEKWSLFLKYANDMKRQKLIERIENETEGIAMAAGILNTVSQDRAMQLAYIGQLMHETDQISRTLHARDKGIAKGRAEGRAKGRAEGVSIGERRGISIGELSKASEAARKMLKRGFDVPTISEITGLAESEILALRR